MSVYQTEELGSDTIIRNHLIEDRESDEEDGEITQRGVNFSFTWTIENFSLVDVEAYQSPNFIVVKDGCDLPTFNLVIFPRHLDKKNEEYLSAYLGLAPTQESQILATFKLSLINDKNEKIHVEGTRSFDFKCSITQIIFSFLLAFESRARSFVPGKPGWGVNLIKRNSLFDPSLGLLQNDILKICCEIIVLGKNVIKPGNIITTIHR